MYSATIVVLNGDEAAMAELRISRAHSNEWYDHLVNVQNGYHFARSSELDSRNGVNAFGEVFAIMLRNYAYLWNAGIG